MPSDKDDLLQQGVDPAQPATDAFRNIKRPIQARAQFYRMTSAQSEKRKLSKVWQPYLCAPIAGSTSAPNTVHIFYQGSPLCHFTSLRPVDWPKGHEWVPLDNVRNRADGESCGATCYDCIEAARHILEP